MKNKSNILIVLSFILLISYMAFLLRKGESKPKIIYVSKDTVVALEEQKNCKKLEGEFTFFLGVTHGQNINDIYRMQCTKNYIEGNKEILETIFDYKIEE